MCCVVYMHIMAEKNMESRPQHNTIIANNTSCVSGEQYSNLPFIRCFFFVVLYERKDIENMVAVVGCWGY